MTECRNALQIRQVIKQLCFKKVLLVFVDCGGFSILNESSVLDLKKKKVFTHTSGAIEKRSCS